MEQKHVKLIHAEFILEHTDGIEIGQANIEDTPIFLKVSGLLLIRMSEGQAFTVKQALEKVLWSKE